MVANLSIPICDTLPQPLKLMGILALDPHLLSYVLTLLSLCRLPHPFLLLAGGRPGLRDADSEGGGVKVVGPAVGPFEGGRVHSCCRR